MSDPIQYNLTRRELSSLNCVLPGIPVENDGLSRVCQPEIRAFRRRYALDLVYSNGVHTTFPRPNLRRTNRQRPKRPRLPRFCCQKCGEVGARRREFIDK